MSKHVRVYAEQPNLFPTLKRFNKRLFDRVAYSKHFKAYILTHSKYAIYPRHALRVIQQIGMSHRVELHNPAKEYWYHHSILQSIGILQQPFNYYFFITNKYLSDIFGNIVSGYRSTKAYFKTLFIEFYQCCVSCHTTHAL